MNEENNNLNSEPVVNQSSSYVAPSNNSKKALIPLIIGLAVILLGIIGFGVYEFFIKGDSTPTNNNDPVINDQTDNGSKSNNPGGATTVGDSTYGYVDIPSDWVKFYDVSGTTALQYSYGTTFIFTLDYYDNGYSAYEFASNYMTQKMNSTDVTDVTGATVTVGKDKKYTAYQVYMYYPAENVFLVTYWFDREDGKIGYMALEGPESMGDRQITDFLSIPESIRFN